MNNLKFDIACDYAKIRNTELRIFQKTKVVHQDSSIFQQRFGCYEKFHLNGTDFIILYGEHTHPIVFYADDIETVEGLEIFV
jgi:hypothetical protein